VAMPVGLLVTFWTSDQEGKVAQVLSEEPVTKLAVGLLVTFWVKGGTWRRCDLAWRSF